MDLFTKIHVVTDLSSHSLVSFSFIFPSEYKLGLKILQPLLA